MDIKEIKIRKSEFSLAGTFLTAMLVMAIFFGMFQWWGFNVSNSGQTMNETYSNINANLTESQQELDDSVNTIRDGLDTVREPDEGIFVTVMNGIRGLGEIIKLPLKTLNIFQKMTDSFVEAFGFVPFWARTLFWSSIVILIVFLIFAIFAGSNNKISK